MASLSSSTRLGNTSTSALVKSARSISTQIANYNDAQQSYIYDFSTKSDGDFANYQAYLKSRISSLQSSGSIGDAQKALTLQKTMMTAQNSNISSTIQAENIQVLAGNATPQDKLGLIQQEFTKAVSIGDMGQAQTLESQAYSLSQSIQVAAQTAATASASLAKASGSSSASEQNRVATTIENGFKQLNADAGAGGMSALNTHLKTWVQQNKGALQAMADASTDPASKASIEKAINSSQPNYFDVAQGVGNAMIVAHYQAYLAELPYDPNTAQGYLDSANNLANGSSKIGTLGGSMTLSDIQTAQQNPAMYVPHENADTGQLKFSFTGGGKPSGTSAIDGYSFDGNGGVIAHFTGQAAGVQLTDKQAKSIDNTLTKLGFSFDKGALKAGYSNDNGFAIQASNSPKWLAPMLAGQQNVQLQAYNTKQGIVTATLDQNGQGHIFLIAEDAKGHHAVYQATGQYKDGNPIFGKQNAHGDYGFDQNSNSLWNPGGTVKVSDKTGALTQDQFKNASAHLSGSSFSVQNLRNNLSSWLGFRTSAQQLINSSQVQVAHITQMRQQADAALAAQHAAQFGAASTPAPHQAPLPVAAPAPRAVAQPVVNIQGSKPNIQGSAPHIQGSSPNIQGGNIGMNLNQSGGGGIPLGHL